MLSIIVPVYNVEKYLSQCIKSILYQTFTDIEIILVDDGSTDKSGNICDAYAAKDPRVKVIHQENKGLVNARKTGLKAASGKYIGYVDGDDWIEPNMYERMHWKMTEEQVDVVMCGRYEDTENMQKPVYHGVSEGRYDKSMLMKSVYPHMIADGSFFKWGVFPGVWDKLFKKDCLEKYQMEVDERLTMGEDAACTYPCLLNADSIYVLEECLYHYRQTPFSMVKADTVPSVLRKQFQLLYHSVLDSLRRYTNIYDLTRQWREYLLFLMTPRAETLYEGMEKLDYLFPFPHVKRGDNIILYGMGAYGQRLYKFMKRTGFCNVLLCADKNYTELRKQGVEADPPDEIEKYDYDAIVIANSFAETRAEVYRELTDRYPKEKVHAMDVELVKSGETLKAFHLL